MESVLLTTVDISRPSRRPPKRSKMHIEDIDSLSDKLQTAALDKSTRLHYLTGFRDYANFCHLHNLALNPSVSTFRRYLAYTFTFCSSGPKYLTGVRHFLLPLFPDFDSIRNHPSVQAVAKGAAKSRHAPVRRKEPLRVHHLTHFCVLAARTGDYDDLLFATILSCAFYGCHRIGELVHHNNPNNVDWSKVIRRASLDFPRDDQVAYQLPYSKTDRFFKGSTIVLCHREVADPVSLLLAYTLRRDRFFNFRTPLFLLRDGNLPSRSWFEKRLFSHLPRSFGGHSTRSGGATYYASIGHSERVIQAMGRWSSNTWAMYIRDNPAVQAELEQAASRRHA